MDRTMVVAGAIAAVAIGFGMFTWPSPAQPPPLELISTGSIGSVTVHVSGAVVGPGLVVVPAGARVADAIAAAGGAAPDADLGGLNLAASVGDGSRILVPGADGGDVSAGDGLVRVNTASVSDLATLPGVGPVLAGRIVAHRDDHGPFESVEDLLSVPGIGEAKLAALRDAVAIP